MTINDSKGDSSSFPAPSQLLLFELFLRAHKAIVEPMETDLYRFGISLRAFQILLRLDLSPQKKMRPHDLVAELGVDQSRVSRLIHSMEDKGYVEKQIVAGDRRGLFVILTNEGHMVLEHTTPHFAAAFAEHFSRRLSKKDLEPFARILRRFLANSPSELGTGWHSSGKYVAASEPS
jgi:DNA-binding MarR family transcriptional regulator